MVSGFHNRYRREAKALPRPDNDKLFDVVEYLQAADSHRTVSGSPSTSCMS